MRFLRDIAQMILGLALLGVIVYALLGQSQSASATGPIVTNLGYTATSSAVTAVSTSARVAATTTNPIDTTNSYVRVYTTICTTSASPVAVLMDQDKNVNATTGGVTTWIAAAAGYDACYEINDRNMYNGSIRASTTAGTANVYVTQYVQ